MMKRMTWTMLLCIALLFLPVSVQAFEPTTEVYVVKYSFNETTILNETNVTYQWMEANLTVYGDGVTHYYHQGPVFEDGWEEVHPGESYDMWNPAEDINVENKDCGAVKGTNVMDLCDLVGGMSPGDEVNIKASDGFNKWFSYTNVYEPEPAQGPMVLTWYRADDGYVPNYYNGMRLLFFADNKTNPWGYHCFGVWNMHECMDEKYLHFYQPDLPASSGLAVKYVDTIAIYSTIEPPAPTTTPAESPTPTQTIVTPNDTSLITPPPQVDNSTEIPYWIMVVILILIVIILILIGGIISVRNECKQK